MEFDSFKEERQRIIKNRKKAKEDYELFEEQRNHERVARVSSQEEIQLINRVAQCDIAPPQARKKVHFCLTPVIHIFVKYTYRIVAEQKKEQVRFEDIPLKAVKFSPRDLDLIEGRADPVNLGEFAFLQNYQNPTRWQSMNKEEQYYKYTDSLLMKGFYKPTKKQSEVMKIKYSKK